MSYDFFGQNLYNGERSILITEGEQDALAAHQMINHLRPKNMKVLCVSIPTGANIKVFQDQEDFLNKFDRITLHPDNDETGLQLLGDVAALLPRVKFLKTSLKDANDMLSKGKTDEFVRGYTNAKRYSPPSIVSISSIDISKPLPRGLSYPWESINSITMGMLEGSITSLGAGPSVGKGLRHGERVMTPSGLVAIEKIKVGDIVIGTTGLPCNVLDVHPQGIKDIFQVNFTDGTTLQVDSSHLWTMRFRSRGYRVLNTLQLLAGHRYGLEKERVYSLPRYSPVIYSKSAKSLPIDPYLLGLWLGEGVVDIDVTTLREEGLLDNKHIPQAYLIGDKHSRFRLVEGLLETKGSMWPTGKGWTFDSTNIDLVLGIITLARSLGMVAKINKTKLKPLYKKRANEAKVICRPCYSCSIRRPVEASSTTGSRRYVDSVIPVGRDYSTCIEVDSPDKLFLAEDFIPTHNSSFVRATQQHLMFDQNVKVGVFSLEESKEVTLRYIIGYMLQKPIHRPNVSYNPKDVIAAQERLEGKLYLYDSTFYNGSWERIELATRYFASQGVQVVFIDPVSALVGHLDSSSQNTALASMMLSARNIIKELPLHIFFVNHLNESKGKVTHAEGAMPLASEFTGSRAQYRFSDVMLGLSRDTLSEDNEEKNTMVVRNLKSRISGDLQGQMRSLSYCDSTGTLQDGGEPPKPKPIELFKQEEKDEEKEIVLRPIEKGNTKCLSDILR
jgi:hypothetical protein